MTKPLPPLPPPPKKKRGRDGKPVRSGVMVRYVFRREKGKGGRKCPAKKTPQRIYATGFELIMYVSSKEYYIYI